MVEVSCSHAPLWYIEGMEQLRQIDVKGVFSCKCECNPTPSGIIGEESRYSKIEPFLRRLEVFMKSRDIGV